MAAPHLFFDPPGAKAPLSELKTTKGLDFVSYLKQSDSGAFARLLGVGRSTSPNGDVITINVQVERPQKVTHLILKEERLAVLFHDDDAAFPEVLALRQDFPIVPHRNLRDSERPLSLCLYDQSYDEVKLDWTPARFLFRLRYWLQMTSTGALHAEDQPLEPLLLGAQFRLILSAGLSLAALQKQSGLMHIFRRQGPAHELTLMAFPTLPDNMAQVDSVAAVFCCPPQTHGVINYRPTNLAELHELCLKTGLSLGEALAAKTREWLLNKPTKTILKCRLVLLLLLPKKRKEDGPVETIDQWAFISQASIEDLGVALEVLAKDGGTAGYLLGTPKMDQKKLSQFSVTPLQVLHGLSQSLAAAMNGLEADSRKVLGIGLGALGSQVFNNLLRAGFGRWTLVDPDTLLPHNCARHFLGEWAVGQNKAIAMANMANAIMESEPGASAIAAALAVDFLNPGGNAAPLDQIYSSADLILDMSASVAVSRRCASSKVRARHISTFLSPTGSTLVITAEDEKRNFRLDWLEMLHYRSVLNVPSLKDSLTMDGGRFRYGNSCRDVSLKLSQDDTALWAATASRVIKKIATDTEASVRVYCLGSSAQVEAVEISVLPVLETVMGAWRIKTDQFVIDKIARLRKSKLPNETGGILLGHFDTEYRICSIIEAIESPPDSQEWPTSYIRGCAGLRELVQHAEAKTLNQVGYVGEWHSHPIGAAVAPSALDYQAYSWLTARMMSEALPAIMMIIGDRKRFCLVSVTQSKKSKLNS